MTSILKVDEIQNTDGKTGLVITPDGSVSGVKYPEAVAPVGRTITSTTMSSYEEGTWVPTVSGVTDIDYKEQRGSYTRMGNLVHCSFQLRVSWTASGELSITNLPFKSRFNSNDYGQGGYFTVQQPNRGTKRLSMYLQPNSSHAVVYNITDQEGYTPPSVNTNYLNGNLFYRV